MYSPFILHGNSIFFHKTTIDAQSYPDSIVYSSDLFWTEEENDKTLYGLGRRGQAAVAVWRVQ